MYHTQFAPFRCPVGILKYDGIPVCRCPSLVDLALAILVNRSQRLREDGRLSILSNGCFTVVTV